MAEIHDLVKEGIIVSRKIQNIPFSDVVKATTPLKFIPLNLQDDPMILACLMKLKHLQ